MIEEWRPIQDYANYEISDHGRVKNIKTDTILTGWNTRGYWAVCLFRAGLPNGKQLKVHRLVADAFCDNPNGHTIVRHLDGNSENNAPENLAWGTQGENMWDVVRHGHHYRANKTHCPQGHPYADDNLYHDKDGTRRCRTCSSEHHRKTYQRRNRKAVL